MAEHTTATDRLVARAHAGSMIGGRYRLEEIAGTGGMATVWRALDERLERPVAIKVMSDALAANPAAVARFAREARTHARIQHPNLVQVYDYSITGGQPYLVMEYIAGATLSERLDHGGFSADEVRALARELLSALAFVHRHGVLHRDVKPANVLLDGQGHARLTDFGVARLEESTAITQAGEVVGTLRFLAPELLDGRPASRQSDLFALGVLLRTVTGESEPHPQVAELIARLTQPDPASRPQDAEAALSALAPDAGRKPAAPGPPRAASTRRSPSRDSTAAAPTLVDTRLAPEDPTVRRELPARHGRHQMRNRLIAVAALFGAAAGSTLIVVDAGGTQAAGRASNHSTPGTRTDASYSGQQRPDRTIDQRLASLASAVRRAAGP